jgi:hypothetical protein
VDREEEVAAVARLQAQVFHEANGFAPLDSLLYYVFQARAPHHSRFLCMRVLMCALRLQSCQHRPRPANSLPACKVCMHSFRSAPQCLIATLLAAGLKAAALPRHASSPLQKCMQFNRFSCRCRISCACSCWRQREVLLGGTAEGSQLLANGRLF